jgi:SET and RING associated domain
MNDKLKANDRFKDRMEVLRKFGFVATVLQKAVWCIPSQTNRYVWIAHSGEYVSGLNTLSEDGERFEDRRDHKLKGAANYGTHASEDIERILFVRTTHLGRNVIKFAGVFVPDLEKSIHNVSAWKRVSDECSLPDGSWLLSNVSK